MAEILINGKQTKVNDKLAAALVQMKKATYVTKVEESEETEDKPKRAYKTKVMKPEGE